MKVAIIANSLDEPRTGVGSYAYNLIRHIAKYKQSHDTYYIVHYKENPILNEISKNRTSMRDLIIPMPNMPLNKVVYKTILLPRRLSEISLDIIHDTYHFGPFLTLNGPKRILTVFDLTPLLYPQTHKKSRVLAHKYLFPIILRKSDIIITDSYNTKQDIMKHFGISETKIRVIHLGVDEDYKPLPEKEVEQIKQRYNLNYPFILYVGTLEPRKNIPTLLKAYYKLKKQGLPHKLVISGKKGWKYKNIFELIERVNLQKDVIFTGYVPREDLSALYNAAELFVYPSLYEGFGLPPLEAMACGTPVITSNTSSLPEVVGNAGIMVDPHDVDGLAKAMYEVLTNDGLREELRKRGLERAKMFGWKKTAEETLEVYEEVYNTK